MGAQDDIPDCDLDLPGLDPAALARAEAALDALSGRYLAWAEADLKRLEAALDLLRASPGRAGLERLFTITHDMKGQAATFGYPLLSELGGRLCRLIDACPEPQAADIERIGALVAAMGEVLRRRLAGDGGAEGRLLVEGLQ